MDPVSAGVGIVGFTVQLGNGAWKLYQFLSAFKEASSYIDEICQDLNTLQAVLEKARSVKVEDHLLEKSVCQALENCSARIERLLTKLEPLRINLLSTSSFKRKYGALIAVLKKAGFEELRGSINKTQDILALTIAISSQDSIQKTYDLLCSLQQSSFFIAQSISHKKGRLQLIEQPENFDELSALSNTSLANDMTSSMLDREDHQSQLLEVSQAPITTITMSHRSSVKMRHPNARKFDKPEAIYRFNTPGLLRKLGISYGIEIATTGLQFCIQPFCPRPEDTPIFQLCQKGDLGSVRTLIHTGYASIWDRDPNGRTPLWYAARSLNVETAEFLLSQGADPHITGSHSQDLPIRTIVKNDIVDVGRRLDMLRLFLKFSVGAYDDFFMIGTAGRLLQEYQRSDKIDWTFHKRLEAVHRCLCPIVAEFAPDDPYKTALVYEAMYLYYQGDGLRWLLANIDTFLDETDPRVSVLHLGLKNLLAQRDYRSMLLIVKKTRNLHRRWGFPHEIEKTGLRSPTWVAMLQSSTFFIWRNLLQEIGYDEEDFLREEAEDDTLLEEGWTLTTLTTLFEYEYIPYEGKKNPENLGCPACERCGYWQLVNSQDPMIIDIGWRRQLKMLRLGMNLTSKQETTEHPFKESPCSSHTRSGNESSGDTQMAIQLEKGELPYRIVCREKCRDGVCVAWVFEDNSSIEEPVLPPYVPIVEEPKPVITPSNKWLEFTQKYEVLTSGMGRIRRESE